MAENNNNNNYSDFNNYPQPAQPIYIAPENTQKQNNKSANTLGIWSIVLGPLSCCCCCIPIPAVVGLILGIVGLGKQKNNACCIIGIVINAIILAYTLYTFAITDWSQISEMMPQIMDMYEEALNDPEAFMENYESYMETYGQYVQG